MHILLYYQIGRSTPTIENFTFRLVIFQFRIKSKLQVKLEIGTVWKVSPKMFAGIILYNSKTAINFI